MPPLATNSKLSPAHTVAAPDGLIDTDGSGCTVIPIVLLVSCTGEAQTAFDVTTQRTVLLFVSDEEV